MAKSRNESINISIFTALKVSEKSDVPVLLMSNPGMGKTTSVEFFAKVRGYHLEVLRGNSTSPEEVLGYDTVPPTLKDGETVVKTTVHLRPSWFNRIIEVKETTGKPTLLFLDEITTAPEHVQSALLQLIFDKTVGPEFLPEDTLIVAAGNYVQNLSNQMSLLPPLMNRFMIYNIVPDVTDLDTFLNSYEGALADPSGKKKDKIKIIEQQLTELDQQEIKDLSEGVKNKIGEYIERQIRETTRALMNSGERVIDLKVTDLQSIYSEATDDTKLYGFVSLRTLGYFTKVAVASYECFGKAGLKSENFANMIDGLVGYGISRDKSKQVKKTYLTKDYLTSMKVVINDIDRIQTTKIPEYEQFFRDVFSKKTKNGLNSPELSAIKTKLDDLRNEGSIKGMERPIDQAIISDFIDVTISSLNGLLGNTKLKVDVKDLKSSMPPEEFAGIITKWNSINAAFDSANNFLKLPGITYDSTINKSFESLAEKVKMYKFRIKSLHKIYVKEGSGYETIVPDLYNSKD